MNERIRELAEQAGFMLWKNESWNPGDVVDWSARYDDELEKFYDLVVQDCANFVREEYDHEHAESIAWMMEVKFGLHGDYA